jgi:hypothetical protein
MKFFVYVTTLNQSNFMSNVQTLYSIIKLKPYKFATAYKRGNKIRWKKLLVTIKTINLEKY